MQFAFGVTAYDSNAEPIDDPDYGQVVARYASWGLGGGSGTDVSIKIPTKPCTKELLGIGEEGSNESDFYQPHEASVRDLNFYWKKL